MPLTQPWTDPSTHASTPSAFWQIVDVERAVDPSALSALDKIGPLADRLGSFALVLIALYAGARGIWVWGTQMRERLAEKDREIAELKGKIATQERLLDRLSGLADRSTELS